MTKKDIKKQAISKKTTTKKRPVLFKKIKIKLADGQKNPRLLVVVTFFTAILLIISTYAWFSVSLDVQIKFFDMVVSTDSGLFISLDGIDFSESIAVSHDSVITGLKPRYPNHTNQWASAGLWPVSSNGISTSNSHKFDMYIGAVSRFKNRIRYDRTFLTTVLSTEEEPRSSNVYIAFDIFLKNVSGSPKMDNLYLDEGTMVDFDKDTPDDVREFMSGIMNSMRFGIVKIGSVPSNASVSAIQNISCNHACEMVIYEPNHLLHSPNSIEKAAELDVVIQDGVYVPTYAIINPGTYLEHENGHPSAGAPLNTNYFALQKTINDGDLGKSIFQLPNGITKLRTYVWIEGQDIDSLETHSRGAAVDVIINFIKDLAGYE